MGCVWPGLSIGCHVISPVIEDRGVLGDLEVLEDLSSVAKVADGWWFTVWPLAVGLLVCLHRLIDLIFSFPNQTLISV